MLLNEAKILFSAELRYYVRLKCTQNVTFFQVFQLLLIIHVDANFNKVLIIVEFEFQVRNIDFVSKRCENWHLNIPFPSLLAVLWINTIEAQVAAAANLSFNCSCFPYRCRLCLSVPFKQIMACSSHYSLQWLLRVKWLVFEVQNLDIFGGKLTQTLCHFEKLPSCFSNLTGI